MSTHIFESITDRFGYGKYLDLEIVIDSETKYINATKLCQLGNKRLKNWLRLDSAKTLLQFFDNMSTGSDLSQWYYEIGRGDIDSKDDTKRNIIMGTYFHRKLIVHIAQWISCEFALKVSEIVDNYNDRRNRDLLKEKDDKIDELMAMMKTLMNMNHDQTDTLKRQETKLDELTSEVKRMRVHLDNDTSQPHKREAILIYRNASDDKTVMRIRCGTLLYLKKYKTNATWYKEYTHISNSKKALNYMRDNGLFVPEKGKTTKTVIYDKNERIYLRKCLKELDNSYAVEH